jgi:hypothetical protein
MIIDEAASGLQAAKLAAVFSDQLGGSPRSTAGVTSERSVVGRAVMTPKPR